MEDIKNIILKALEEGNSSLNPNDNIQFIDSLPYIWKYAKVNYRGLTSKAAPSGFFDEVITGLLNIEEGLSKVQIGNIIGFTVEDNLPKMEKADEAELELLTEAIDSLKNRGMIIGDDNGFFNTEKGEILAIDGWTPIEQELEFNIFLDNLNFEEIKGSGKVFEKWNLNEKQTLSRLDILKSDFEKLDIDFEINDSLLRTKINIDEEKYGLQLIGEEDGTFKYQISNAPYKYHDFALNIVEHDEKIKAFAYEHDKKAHYPEERCILLSEKTPPELIQVTEKGVEVVICLLNNNDEIEIRLFDPISKNFSTYLTDTFNKNESLRQDIIERWLNDNPQFKKDINLSDREEQINKEVKEEIAEIAELIIEAKKDNNKMDAIEERINQGRKAFDEFEFELELDRLFSLIENEIWLNFPRLRNQPLNERLSQLKQALDNNVNVFLGYSDDYLNVDSMHDSSALNAYQNLDKEYKNFFLSKLELSHKRTILAIANDNLKFEYIPSYNIMSFAPFGIEEEIAREINYRIPWDNVSQDEYDNLKNKFLDVYKQKFEDYFMKYQFNYDFKMNARKNYELLEKEINNVSYWSAALNINREEIEQRVDRFLSNELEEFVNAELDLLEQNLNDETLTSDKGKLTPKSIIGRLYSLESWSKIPDITFPPDAQHRINIIRANTFDKFPDLKKKGGKSKGRNQNRSNHKKINNRK